jgi:hypothetical protein
MATCTGPPWESKDIKNSQLPWGSGPAGQLDTPQLWGEWGYRAATLIHLDPLTLGLPGREPTPWGWIAVGRAGRLR